MSRRKPWDPDELPRANCPECKQTDIPVKDGKLWRHNIPQHVPGPEELEAKHGGIFRFVKCDNVTPGKSN